MNHLRAIKCKKKKKKTGGVAARGPPVGVLRSAAHRRAESRFWGVFIFAVHLAFVLGLGARHRGIVDLSEGVIRCVTVFACYSSSSSSAQVSK